MIALEIDPTPLVLDFMRMVSSKMKMEMSSRARFLLAELEVMLEKEDQQDFQAVSIILASKALDEIMGIKVENEGSRK